MKRCFLCFIDRIFTAHQSLTRTFEILLRRNSGSYLCPVLLMETRAQRDQSGSPSKGRAPRIDDKVGRDY